MANIKVAVRVRPLSRREIENGDSVIVDVNDNFLTIKNAKLESRGGAVADSRERKKTFGFDACYDSMEETSGCQELVFQDLGLDVLQSAFDGFDACLFAYGQTGTGKTFTMMGTSENPGLTPRICEVLFSRVYDETLATADNDQAAVTYKVECSYYEIYNERVRDLLRSPAAKERFSLKVREHPKTGPFVEDLSSFVVRDLNEIRKLIDKGNQRRATAATHMHAYSSRSHGIFQITFSQASIVDGLPSEVVSRVNLVDLAGSERSSPHEVYTKERMKEGSNINRSLITLGNVITALAERGANNSPTDIDSIATASSSSGYLSSPARQQTQRSNFVPYRDSVLTWLLRSSLGGSAKTVMVATISPSSSNYSESVSTLLYAQRAKAIVNVPTVNEDPNVRLIRELRQEIYRLREILAKTHLESGLGLQDSISERLQCSEQMADKLTKCWIDKWFFYGENKQEPVLCIRRPNSDRRGQAVLVESQLPHLVALDEDDVTGTGVLIYHLDELAKTVLGADPNADIGLRGPGVAAECCSVQNLNGRLALVPHQATGILINGSPISEPTPLSHGDLLVLGYTNVFRFNNPQEAARLRQSCANLSSVSSVSTLSLDSAAAFLGPNHRSRYNRQFTPYPSSPLAEGVAAAASSSFFASTQSLNALYSRPAANSLNRLEINKRSRNADSQQQLLFPPGSPEQEVLSFVANQGELLPASTSVIDKDLPAPLAWLHAARVVSSLSSRYPLTSVTELRRRAIQRRLQQLSGDNLRRTRSCDSLLNLTVKDQQTSTTTDTTSSSCQHRHPLLLASSCTCFSCSFIDILQEVAEDLEAAAEIMQQRPRVLVGNVPARPCDVSMPCNPAESGRILIQQQQRLSLQPNQGGRQSLGQKTGPSPPLRPFSVGGSQPSQHHPYQGGGGGSGLAHHRMQPDGSVEPPDMAHVIFAKSLRNFPPVSPVPASVSPIPASQHVVLLPALPPTAGDGTFAVGRRTPAGHDHQQLCEDCLRPPQHKRTERRPVMLPAYEQPQRTRSASRPSSITGTVPQKPEIDSSRSFTSAAQLRSSITSEPDINAGETVTSSGAILLPATAGRKGRAGQSGAGKRAKSNQQTADTLENEPTASCAVGNVAADAESGIVTRKRGRGGGPAVKRRAPKFGVFSLTVPLPSSQSAPRLYSASEMASANANGENLVIDLERIENSLQQGEKASSEVAKSNQAEQGTSSSASLSPYSLDMTSSSPQSTTWSTTASPQLSAVQVAPTLPQYTTLQVNSAGESDERLSDDMEGSFIGRHASINASPDLRLAAGRLARHPLHPDFSAATANGEHRQRVADLIILASHATPSISSSISELTAAMLPTAAAVESPRARSAATSLLDDMVAVAVSSISPRNRAFDSELGPEKQPVSVTVATHGRTSSSGSTTITIDSRRHSTADQLPAVGFTQPASISSNSRRCTTCSCTSCTCTSCTATTCTCTCCSSCVTTEFSSTDEHVLAEVTIGGPPYASSSPAVSAISPASHQPGSSMAVSIAFADEADDHLVEHSYRHPSGIVSPPEGSPLPVVSRIQSHKSSVERVQSPPREDRPLSIIAGSSQSSPQRPTSVLSKQQDAQSMAESRKRRFSSGGDQSQSPQRPMSPGTTIILPPEAFSDNWQVVVQQVSPRQISTTGEQANIARSRSATPSGQANVARSRSATPSGSAVAKRSSSQEGRIVSPTAPGISLAREPAQLVYGKLATDSKEAVSKQAAADEGDNDTLLHLCRSVLTALEDDEKQNDFELSVEYVRQQAREQSPGRTGQTEVEQGSDLTTAGYSDNAGAAALASRPAVVVVLNRSADLTTTAETVRDMCSGTVGWQQLGTREPSPSRETAARVGAVASSKSETVLHPWEEPHAQPTYVRRSASGTGELEMDVPIGEETYTVILPTAESSSLEIRRSIEEPHDSYVTEFPKTDNQHHILSEGDIARDQHLDAKSTAGHSKAGTRSIGQRPQSSTGQLQQSQPLGCQVFRATSEQPVMSLSTIVNVEPGQPSQQQEFSRRHASSLSWLNDPAEERRNRRFNTGRNAYRQVRRSPSATRHSASRDQVELAHEESTDDDELCVPPQQHSKYHRHSYTPSVSGAKFLPAYSECRRSQSVDSNGRALRPSVTFDETVKQKKPQTGKASSQSSLGYNLSSVTAAPVTPSSSLVVRTSSEGCVGSDSSRIVVSTMSSTTRFEQRSVSGHSLAVQPTTIKIEQTICRDLSKSPDPDFPITSSYVEIDSPPIARVISNKASSVPYLRPSSERPLSPQPILQLMRSPRRRRSASAFGEQRGASASSLATRAVSGEIVGQRSAVNVKPPRPILAKSTEAMSSSTRGAGASANWRRSSSTDSPNRMSRSTDAIQKPLSTSSLASQPQREYDGSLRLQSYAYESDVPTLSALTGTTTPQETVRRPVLLPATGGESRSRSTERSQFSETRAQSPFALNVMGQGVLLSSSNEPEGKMRRSTSSMEKASESARDRGLATSHEGRSRETVQRSISAKGLEQLLGAVMGERFSKSADLMQVASSHDSLVKASSGVSQTSLERQRSGEIEQLLLPRSTDQNIRMATSVSPPQEYTSLSSKDYPGDQEHARRFDTANPAIGGQPYSPPFEEEDSRALSGVERQTQQELCQSPLPVKLGQPISSPSPMVEGGHFVSPDKGTLPLSGIRPPSGIPVLGDQPQGVVHSRSRDDGEAALCGSQRYSSSPSSRSRPDLSSPSTALASDENVMRSSEPYRVTTSRQEELYSSKYDRPLSGSGASAGLSPRDKGQPQGIIRSRSRDDSEAVLRSQRYSSSPSSRSRADLTSSSAALASDENVVRTSEPYRVTTSRQEYDRPLSGSGASTGLSPRDNETAASIDQGSRVSRAGLEDVKPPASDRRSSSDYRTSPKPTFGQESAAAVVRPASITSSTGRRDTTSSCTCTSCTSCTCSASGTDCTCSCTSECYRCANAGAVSGDPTSPRPHSECRRLSGVDDIDEAQAVGLLQKAISTDALRLSKELSSELVRPPSSYGRRSAATAGTDAGSETTLHYVGREASSVPLVETQRYPLISPGSSQSDRLNVVEPRTASDTLQQVAVPHGVQPSMFSSQQLASEYSSEGSYQRLVSTSMPNIESSAQLRPFQVKGESQPIFYPSGKIIETTCPEEGESRPGSVPPTSSRREKSPLPRSVSPGSRDMSAEKQSELNVLTHLGAGRVSSSPILQQSAAEERKTIPSPQRPFIASDDRLSGQNISSDQLQAILPQVSRIRQYFLSTLPKRSQSAELPSSAQVQPLSGRLGDSARNIRAQSPEKVVQPYDRLISGSGQDITRKPLSKSQSLSAASSGRLASPTERFVSEQALTSSPTVRAPKSPAQTGHISPASQREQIIISAASTLQQVEGRSFGSLSFPYGQSHSPADKPHLAGVSSLPSSRLNIGDQTVAGSLRSRPDSPSQLLSPSIGRSAGSRQEVSSNVPLIRSRSQSPSALTRQISPSNLLAGNNKSSRENIAQFTPSMAEDQTPDRLGGSLRNVVPISPQMRSQSPAQRQASGGVIVSTPDRFCACNQDVTLTSPTLRSSPALLQTGAISPSAYGRLTEIEQNLALGSPHFSPPHTPIHAESQSVEDILKSVQKTTEMLIEVSVSPPASVTRHASDSRHRRSASDAHGLPPLPAGGSLAACRSVDKPLPIVSTREGDFAAVRGLASSSKSQPSSRGSSVDSFRSAGVVQRSASANREQLEIDIGDESNLVPPLLFASPVPPPPGFSLDEGESVSVDALLAAVESHIADTLSGSHRPPSGTLGMADQQRPGDDLAKSRPSSVPVDTPLFIQTDAAILAPSPRAATPTKKSPLLGVSSLGFQQQEKTRFSPAVRSPSAEALSRSGDTTAAGIFPVAMSPHKFPSPFVSKDVISSQSPSDLQRTLSIEQPLAGQVSGRRSAASPRDVTPLADVITAASPLPYGEASIRPSSAGHRTPSSVEAPLFVQTSDSLPATGSRAATTSHQAGASSTELGRSPSKEAAVLGRAVSVSSPQTVTPSAQKSSLLDVTMPIEHEGGGYVPPSSDFQPQFHSPQLRGSSQPSSLQIRESSVHDLASPSTPTSAHVTPAAATRKTLADLGLLEIPALSSSQTDEERLLTVQQQKSPSGVSSHILPSPSALPAAASLEARHSPSQNLQKSDQPARSADDLSTQQLEELAKQEGLLMLMLGMPQQVRRFASGDRLASPTSAHASRSTFDDGKQQFRSKSADPRVISSGSVVANRIASTDVPGFSPRIVFEMVAFPEQEQRVATPRSAAQPGGVHTPTRMPEEPSLPSDSAPSSSPRRRQELDLSASPSAMVIVTGDLASLDTPFAVASENTIAQHEGLPALHDDEEDSEEQNASSTNQFFGTTQSLLERLADEQRKSSEIGTVSTEPLIRRVLSSDRQLEMVGISADLVQTDLQDRPAEASDIVALPPEAFGAEYARQQQASEEIGDEEGKTCWNWLHGQPSSGVEVAGEPSDGAQPLLAPQSSSSQLRLSSSPNKMFGEHVKIASKPPRPPTGVLPPPAFRNQATSSAEGSSVTATALAIADNNDVPLDVAARRSQLNAEFMSLLMEASVTICALALASVTGGSSQPEQPPLPPTIANLMRTVTPRPIRFSPVVQLVATNSIISSDGDEPDEQQPEEEEEVEPGDGVSARLAKAEPETSAAGRTVEFGASNMPLLQMSPPQLRKKEPLSPHHLAPQQATSPGIKLRTTSAQGGRSGIAKSGQTELHGASQQPLVSEDIPNFAAAERSLHVQPATPTMAVSRCSDANVSGVFPAIMSSSTSLSLSITDVSSSQEPLPTMTDSYVDMLAIPPRYGAASAEQGLEQQRHPDRQMPLPPARHLSGIIARSSSPVSPAPTKPLGEPLVAKGAPVSPQLGATRMSPKVEIVQAVVLDESSSAVTAAKSPFTATVTATSPVHHRSLRSTSAGTDDAGMVHSVAIGTDGPPDSRCRAIETDAQVVRSVGTEHDFLIEKVNQATGGDEDMAALYDSRYGRSFADASTGPDPDRRSQKSSSASPSPVGPHNVDVSLGTADSPRFWQPSAGTVAGWPEESLFKFYQQYASGQQQQPPGAAATTSSSRHERQRTRHVSSSSTSAAEMAPNEADRRAMAQRRARSQDNRQEREPSPQVPRTPSEDSITFVFVEHPAAAISTTTKRKGDRSRVYESTEGTSRQPGESRRHYADDESPTTSGSRVRSVSLSADTDASVSHGPASPHRTTREHATSPGISRFDSRGRASSPYVLNRGVGDDDVMRGYRPELWATTAVQTELVEEALRLMQTGEINIPLEDSAALPIWSSMAVQTDVPEEMLQQQRNRIAEVLASLQQARPIRRVRSLDSRAAFLFGIEESESHIQPPSRRAELVESAVPGSAKYVTERKETGTSASPPLPPSDGQLYEEKLRSKKQAVSMTTSSGTMTDSSLSPSEAVPLAHSVATATTSTPRRLPRPVVEVPLPPPLPPVNIAANAREAVGAKLSPQSRRRLMQLLGYSLPPEEQVTAASRTKQPVGKPRAQDEVAKLSLNTTSPGYRPRKLGRLFTLQADRDLKIEAFRIERQRELNLLNADEKLALVDAGTEAVTGISTPSTSLSNLNLATHAAQAAAASLAGGTSPRPPNVPLMKPSQLCEYHRLLRCSMVELTKRSESALSGSESRLSPLPEPSGAPSPSLAFYSTSDQGTMNRAVSCQVLSSTTTTVTTPGVATSRPTSSRLAHTHHHHVPAQQQLAIQTGQQDYLRTSTNIREQQMQPLVSGPDRQALVVERAARSANLHRAAADGYQSLLMVPQSQRQPSSVGEATRPAHRLQATSGLSSSVVIDSPTDSPRRMSQERQREERQSAASYYSSLIGSTSSSRQPLPQYQPQPLPTVAAVRPAPMPISTVTSHASSYMRPSPLVASSSSIAGTPHVSSTYRYAQSQQMQSGSAYASAAPSLANAANASMPTQSLFAASTAGLFQSSSSNGRYNASSSSNSRRPPPPPPSNYSDPHDWGEL